jgi:RimJ/RimL family protein N-acetyltransferase
MHLIYGLSDAVAAWTGDKLGYWIAPPLHAIGIADADGMPIGGIVFNDWNGYNLEISIYGPGAMNRRTIAAAYTYAFTVAKATRLTGRVKRSNTALKAMLPRLGFELEGVLHHYYGAGRNNDAFIYRLDPQAAAKWMVSNG